MPDSRTRILIISLDADCERGDSARPPVVFATCHVASLCPPYSMRKDKNMPAIKIAAAVPSYASSPKHLFSNMRWACVNNCMDMSVSNLMV